MPVTTEQRKIVLEELEQGKSLRAACRTADIPNEASIRFIVANDADYASHYARARVLGWEARADTLMDAAYDMSIDPQHKRIIIDAQKWELSKMLPKYSDKLDLSATVQASVTLVTTPTDEAL